MTHIAGREKKTWWKELICKIEPNQFNSVVIIPGCIITISLVWEMKPLTQQSSK